MLPVADRIGVPVSAGLCTKGNSALCTAGRHSFHRQVARSTFTVKDLNCEKSSDEKPRKPTSAFYSKITAAVLATVLVVVGSAILYVLEKKLDVRLIFDNYDMNVYFGSASWVAEGGRLYREVPSEYPLFANIIFAIARWLGNFIYPGFYGFYLVWMVLAGFVYLTLLTGVITRTRKHAVLAWLAPAPIYFALYRFDIYPAAATLMALFAIRRAAYFQGAAWLGVAIALKGYALVFLPAYFVFLVYQRGLATAIKAGVLAVAPTILSLIAIFSFAGWEGVLAPLKFHAVRTLNEASTYAAINYLFRRAVISAGANTKWVAYCLQIGCALVAAAMRPRTFEALVNTFLFAVLGFMTFSVFYSPQFILWILPLVCFTDSPIMLLSAICFSWLTYLYFPIARDLSALGRHGLDHLMVVSVSFLRLFMMVLAAYASPNEVRRNTVQQNLN